jgi:hypothetical protein
MQSKLCTWIFDWLLAAAYLMNNNCIIECRKGRYCRFQSPRDLRPIACWNCGFESHGGNGYLSLVSVVFCQVEFSASGRSLVQRSPTERGGCVYVHEVYIMRRSWPIRGSYAIKKQ